MANILVSFSGGKTSGYMAKKIKDEWSKRHNLLFIFANTGQEHDLTLDFVNMCDKAFSLDLVWVEALVRHEEMKGTGFQVVSYETASRKGEPFEDVIKKYGIPNHAYPHCNRELKLSPIHAYAKRHFSGEEYLTAIGIRIDEPKRLSEKNGIIYPLATDFPVDKQDVNDWWESMPFTLEIPSHHGNCKTCWKKSYRKLLTIAAEHPEWFDFFASMEDRYGRCGYFDDDGEGRRVFFRQHRTARQMLELAKKSGMRAFVEDSQYQHKLFGYDLDADSGCSESCEAY